MVVSWAEGKVESLDLLIIPRKGITKELLRHTNTNIILVMFSGPHGTIVPVEDYDSVVMVASGLGIAAQLPYLKQLVHNHNNHKARTRKIHLIWCLQSNSESVSICVLAKLTHICRHWAFLWILAASMDDSAHWSDPCIRLIAANDDAAATNNRHHPWIISNTRG